MALAMLLIIIHRATGGRLSKQAMVWGIVGVFCSSLPALARSHSYEKDSLYHHIIVTDDNGMRTLRFDRLRQSALDLNEPDRMVFHYTQYLHLAMAFHDNPQRVLFIGLGRGVDATPVPPRLSHLADRRGRARPRGGQRRQALFHVSGKRAHAGTGSGWAHLPAEDSASV